MCRVVLGNVSLESGSKIPILCRTPHLDFGPNGGARGATLTRLDSFGRMEMG